jgi:hypothetical protein
METHGSVGHSKRFTIDPMQRKISRIELLIQELSLEAAKLDNEIAAAEKKAGISDPQHFAYPCYAKATAQRRDNLVRTVEELQRQSHSLETAPPDAADSDAAARTGKEASSRSAVTISSGAHSSRISEARWMKQRSATIAGQPSPIRDSGYDYRRDRAQT